MYESHQGIPSKYIKFIQACVSASKGRVRIGRSVSDEFTVTNRIKEGDASFLLPFNLVLDYVVRGLHKMTLY